MAGFSKSWQVLKQGQVGAAVFLLIMLAMMMLPLPPLLLDILFTFNIVLSLLVLLVAMNTMRPLDFAVFPTVLLAATLLRLALNIASTRVVLLHGHQGGDAAGKVIEAFGEVVIGGNYAVGLVVFLILIIINFVVVTKGAGRIAEVSARFILDAMPGKQMAIDADLNAGLINQEDAKARRADIAAEADFYGSMDGASKFVRGDAVAGILILLINIIGGLIIGMVQHGLTFSDAAQKYALLTIGDGLVAQIPSLLLSTAAAMLVTRVSSSQGMSAQVNTQMFQNREALQVSAGVLMVMGLVPGMPHVAFLGMGALCFAASRMIKASKPLNEKTASINNSTNQELMRSGSASPVLQGELAPNEMTEMIELGWDDVQPVDMIGLEVGYRLIPLVDKSQGGQLLARIKGVRKKNSQDLGFLMPTVHIRDNLDLLPNAYQITLKGVPVATGEVQFDRDLAINPGQVFGTLPGIKTKDPSFGLDAVWIEGQQKDQAQTLGYTVVDASTVVATHVNQIMSLHAHELLGFEEVQNLLDQLAKKNKKLVESVVPNPISLSVLLRVLQSLLREQVPIRDFKTIVEALSQIPQAQSAKPEILIAAARLALSRMIVQNLTGTQSDIPVITLQPDLEQILLKSVQQAQQAGGNDSDAIIEPQLAERLQKTVIDLAQKQEMQGHPAIMLVAAGIRNMLARFIRFSMPSLHVLAYSEIPDGKKITVVGNVGSH
jgi:flagellar biosynthesis protein FlhA